MSPTARKGRESRSEEGAAWGLLGRAMDLPAVPSTSVRQRPFRRRAPTSGTSHISAKPTHPAGRSRNTLASHEPTSGAAITAPRRAEFGCDFFVAPPDKTPPPPRTGPPFSDHRMPGVMRRAFCGAPPCLSQGRSQLRPFPYVISLTQSGHGQHRKFRNHRKARKIARAISTRHLSHSQIWLSSRGVAARPVSGRSPPVIASGRRVRL